MNLTIFIGFVVFFALAISGRRLRERAFRELSVEQRVQVADKMPNYTAAEMIPAAGLLLGLVGVLLFRLAWLRSPWPFSCRLSCFLLACFICEHGTDFESSVSRRRSCRNMRILESSLTVPSPFHWRCWHGLSIVREAYLRDQATRRSGPPTRRGSDLKILLGDVPATPFRLAA